MRYSGDPSDASRRLRESSAHVYASNVQRYTRVAYGDTNPDASPHQHVGLTYTHTSATQ